ncbi:MAG TPA: FHA domain-containing protein [Pirellulales bacterium]|nr:FHA domain-containing protein [Pirellulales bacterium]
MNRPAPFRFLLWIDMVGGYWVCGDEVVALGRPSTNADVDVPIMADLSRRHAILRRDGEGYLLQPLREVRLNGSPQTTACWLKEGSLIELGSTVRLRFTKPHPLSATARLDFVSPHRTSPPTDAILLMAQSCILGPQPTSHVVCRRWTREVILHRQGNGLSYRGPKDSSIDEQPPCGCGPLPWNARVAGSNFSFSLEPLGGSQPGQT